MSVGAGLTNIEKARIAVDGFLRGLSATYRIPVSYLTVEGDRERLERWVVRALEEEDFKDEV